MSDPERCPCCAQPLGQAPAAAAGADEVQELRRQVHFLRLAVIRLRGLGVGQTIPAGDLAVAGDEPAAVPEAGIQSRLG